MLEKVNENSVKRYVSNIIGVLMVVAVSMSLASCGDDEPASGDSAIETPSLVNADQLAGTWMLVRDNVLYSEVNAQKTDEVINYKGNGAPYYHYYQVTVSDIGVITMVEVSVSGAVIGTPVSFTLDQNELVTVEGNEVAGTIELYNTSHSWDNLEIRWKEAHSPISFGAPVVSTYKL